MTITLTGVVAQLNKQSKRVYFNHIPAIVKKHYLYLTHNNETKELKLQFRLTKEKLEALKGFELVDEQERVAALNSLTISKAKIKEVTLNVTLDYLLEILGKSLALVSKLGLYNEYPELAKVSEVNSIHELNAINFESLDYSSAKKINREKSNTKALLINKEDGTSYHFDKVKELTSEYEKANINCNLTLATTYLNPERKLRNRERFEKYLTDFIPIAVKFQGLDNLLLDSLIQISPMYQNAYKLSHSEDGYVLYATKADLVRCFNVYPKKYKVDFWLEYFSFLAYPEMFPGYNTEIIWDKANNKMIDEESYLARVEGGDDRNDFLRRKRLYMIVSRMIADRSKPVDNVYAYLANATIDNLTN